MTCTRKLDDKILCITVLAAGVVQYWAPVVLTVTSSFTWDCMYAMLQVLQCFSIFRTFHEV